MKHIYSVVHNHCIKFPYLVREYTAIITLSDTVEYEFQFCNYGLNLVYHMCQAVAIKYFDQLTIHVSMQLSP